MTASVALSDDSTAIIVTIPFKIRRRGGRKRIIIPDGADSPLPQTAEPSSVIVKALGRAHRWRRMLESGHFSSIGELARTERVNESYLCRVLRLTLLAPDIVEAILDGTLPMTVQLSDLLAPLPVEWAEQRRLRAPVRCD